ncbi:tetratricopeptide repeat protein [Mailhella sp.]|uniref:tetratricopeptide repeat protein n=1 Tax=Mailhella sp. TaxID=1981029 RepID=UPI00406492DD
MLEPSQTVRLLDIANAGCHRGLVQEARTIYESILVLKPGHVPARIGLALSRIVVDEFAEAEALLRALLDEQPRDAHVRSMLGLCLSLSGRKDEARTVLEDVKDSEGAGARLAASLLEQMD